MGGNPGHGRFNFLGGAMESTIYIEIPVNVTFSVDPGQKGSWDEPGYPAQVEDIDFDRHQVIEAVSEAIYGEKSTIDEDLMADAEEAGRNYEFEKADYLYEQKKDRELEAKHEL